MTDRAKPMNNAGEPAKNIPLTRVDDRAKEVEAILDSFHNHTCQSCKGSGCINCRNTGMNQTPCLVCDEDGIA